MKPWMVWPLVGAIAGLCWIAGKASECPDGQIAIRQGYAVACVVGHWR